MSSTVEQIKAKLNIEEVVGSYVKLEKAGGNWRACCPFHNEKTPSFFVSPTRQSYHCFGCNRGGDIFSFVQEIEGLDFKEALIALAARAGVELKPFDQKAQSANERLYKALAAAADYYRSQLAAASSVRQYLAARGLTDETINNWQLGFAPAGWRNLADHLAARGFTTEEQEKAGLVIKSETKASARDDRFYDRFRSRIMFPLFDQGGRVIGFSGRIFQGKEDEAKYVNSPQTALYDKSNFLYGYDRAKMAMKQKGACVLVEGQMDLLLSHQAGVTNAVAVSGTALTDRHLHLIKRLADRLIMAFDADKAGLAAARRGIDLALLAGLEIQAVELPAGLDPADLVLQNPERWPQIVDSAKHMIDFHLAALRERHAADARALKLAVGAEIIPYLPKITNALDRAHFVSKIAAFLGIAEDPVWEEVKKAEQKIGHEGGTALAIESTPAIKLTRSQLIGRRLFGLYSWQKSLPTPTLDLAPIDERLREILGEDRIRAWQQALAPLVESLILEAELTYGDNKDLEREAGELLSSWREEILKEELQRVMMNLRQAEEKGDEKSIQDYLARCQLLSKEINESKQF